MQVNVQSNGHIPVDKDEPPSVSVLTALPQFAPQEPIAHSPWQDHAPSSQAQQQVDLSVRQVMAAIPEEETPTPKAPVAAAPDLSQTLPGSNDAPPLSKGELRPVNVQSERREYLVVPVNPGPTPKIDKASIEVRDPAAKDPTFQATGTLPMDQANRQIQSDVMPFIPAGVPVPSTFITGRKPADPDVPTVLPSRPVAPGRNPHTEETDVSPGRIAMLEKELEARRRKLKSKNGLSPSQKVIAAIGAAAAIAIGSTILYANGKSKGQKDLEATTATAVPTASPKPAQEPVSVPVNIPTAQATAEVVEPEKTADPIPEPSATANPDIDLDPVPTASAQAQPVPTASTPKLWGKLPPSATAPSAKPTSSAPKLKGGIMRDVPF